MATRERPAVVVREVVAQTAADKPTFEATVVKGAHRVDHDRAGTTGEVKGGLAVAERPASELLVGRLADIQHEIHEVAVVTGTVGANGPPEPVSAEVSEIEN